MIIAFMAEYATGKDYFCEHLLYTGRASHRLSFSDEVRQLAVTMFPWLPFFVDPKVKDKPFIHPKNPHGLTPRDIWLLAGKVRYVTPSYFVDSFVNRYDLETLHSDINRIYIITDFRTPDEWDLLQKYHIPVIKLELEDRGDRPPSAFEDYVRRFKDYDAKFINKLNGTDEFDVFFERFLNDYSIN